MVRLSYSIGKVTGLSWQLVATLSALSLAQIDGICP